MKFEDEPMSIEEKRLRHQHQTMLQRLWHDLAVADIQRETPAKNGSIDYVNKMVDAYDKRFNPDKVK